LYKSSIDLEGGKQNNAKRVLSLLIPFTKARLFMGRLTEMEMGTPLLIHHSGYPFFSPKPERKLLIGDIWGFLRDFSKNNLTREKKKEAVTYVDQSLGFFNAADNPQMRSKPLLYYYSFLNLVKVALLLGGYPIPLKPQHGISIADKQRKRITLTGEEVEIHKRKSTGRNIMSSFASFCGKEFKSNKKYKILDLLKQIPSIHNTYARVTGARLNFIPIRNISILRNGKKYWIVVIIEKSDANVDQIIKSYKKTPKFTGVLKQVRGPDNFYIFETPVKHSATGGGPGVNKLLKTLGANLLNLNISAILTRDGYRYYFNTVDDVEYVPCLVADYAVAYYLGTITRYKPYYFESIITHKYATLINEYLATVPEQFVYRLASKVSGVEIVKPYAAI
jgi:hypothetical protein